MNSNWYWYWYWIGAATAVIDVQNAKNIATNQIAGCVVGKGGGGAKNKCRQVRKMSIKNNTERGREGEGERQTEKETQQKRIASARCN